MKPDKKNKRPLENKHEEEGAIKAQFMRWLSKYDFRDRDRFTNFIRRLIFSILIIVVAFVLLQHINEFNSRGGFSVLIPLLFAAALLLGVEAVKLFGKQRETVPWRLYVLQAIAVGGMSFAANGTAAVFAYMLVLTELYVSVGHQQSSLLVFGAAALLYAAVHILQNYLLFEPTHIWSLLTQLISTMISFAIHFLIVQIALAFYGQFLRLNDALQQLHESKQELEKAYEVVAEVTALEERQRIAKEIHDTAGHSITTVIMQTESAKLLVMDEPEEAKKKIVAANLQAKHALEELRNSVHVLSGKKEQQTLKDALEAIIHESTDGTDITIRSEIEDMMVSEAKHRFLCNTLKEGISNGLRHGRATAFWFECKAQMQTIRFLLSDNGSGVCADTLAFGFGLSSMQDRVKALGGEMNIVTNEGEGFEIEILLPI